MRAGSYKAVPLLRTIMLRRAVTQGFGERIPPRCEKGFSHQPAS